MRIGSREMIETGRNPRIQELILLALPVLVALGIASGPAQAAPAEILASDEDFVFVGTPFEQPQGEVATFTNPAGAPALHNVYAENRGPDGRPLFFSDTISPGASTDVDGTQYLRPGLYDFVCTLHPGMDASLRISTQGSPVPRPAVRVSIPNQRIGVISRKGKVRVILQSPTGVEGARVALSIGNKVVGRANSLRVSPGGKRSLSVTLSSRGRKVLKGKKAVALKATSSVDFGKSFTDRRVIR